MKAATRNLALFGGMIAAGAVGALASPWLENQRGASGPLVLQAEDPLIAVLAIGIALAVITLIGIAVGRASNTAIGLFVIGVGLFVLAGRLETVQELAFGSESGERGALLLAAVETLLWAGACFGIVATMFRFVGPLRDVEPLDDGTSPHWLRSSQALRSAAAAVLVIVIVWLIARSPMKGQMIGATALGSMAAGLIGRLVSPHVQPVLLLVAPVVVGALGHVIGLLMVNRPLAEAYVLGELSPLSLPMPIDYAAGAMMGVPLGLGWAKSFLHHEEEAETVAS